MSTAYFIKELSPSSGAWTSDVHHGDDRRARQDVISGFTGTPRWVERASGAFIYGLSKNGKELTSAPTSAPTATPARTKNARREDVAVTASQLAALSKHRCDAEIADRVAMRRLPKGRLAWKGCRALATVRVHGRFGGFLHYCDKHAKRADGRPSTRL